MNKLHIYFWMILMLLLSNSMKALETLSITSNKIVLGAGVDLFINDKIVFIGLLH